jgi:cysteine sulfinate desulfinase/cysteine desulfurase-like protein
MDLLSALLIIIILILIWKIFRSSFSNSIYDKYDYFDYAATTPPYEEALCYNDIGTYQGNLSQSYNKENRENLEKINRTILGQIFHNNEDYRLIWTSGASEANNTVNKIIL